MVLKKQRSRAYSTALMFYYCLYYAPPPCSVVQHETLRLSFQSPDPGRQRVQTPYECSRRRQPEREEGGGGRGERGEVRGGEGRGERREVA